MLLRSYQTLKSLFTILLVGGAVFFIFNLICCQNKSWSTTPETVELTRNGQPNSNSLNISWNTKKILTIPIVNDSAYSAILLIMVNDRSKYLRGLIESLSRVRGIENTLLVFSHNVDSPEINEIIKSEANFAAKTMQIFFPYRLQVYTKEFPGQNPLDCPRNIPKNEVFALCF